MSLHGLIAYVFLILNNIPLSGWTTVYLSITHWRASLLLPSFDKYEYSYYKLPGAGVCVDITPVFELRPPSSGAAPSSQLMTEHKKVLGTGHFCPVQNFPNRQSWPQSSLLGQPRLCQVWIEVWSSPCSVLPPPFLSFIGLSPSQPLVCLTLSQCLLRGEPKWLTRPL